MLKSARLAAMTALMILSIAGAAGAQPLVQKALPAANAVSGFSIVPKTLVYGKGHDISKIYNGGYELYTRNGVLDAARQMYQRKSDYIEVTVHTMKSEKAALDFLKYWQKEHKAEKLTTTKTSAGFTITKPAIMTYRTTEKYFVTVAAFYSSDTGAADTAAFASRVEKLVLGFAKPKGSG